MKRLPLVCLCLLLLNVVGCYQVSMGSRTGELVKFSEKGFFSTTGEGDLVLNFFGMKSQTSSKYQSGQTGNVWHFSVANDNPKYRELCDKLASLNGKFVKVHYVEEWLVSPFRASTKYLVTSVEEVQP